MAEKKKSNLLNALLIIYAIIALVYGLGYLLCPESLVELAGDEPINPSWLRWCGAVLLGLAWGSFTAFRSKEREQAFLGTINWGTLLTGLTLLYSWIFEMTGNTWFTAAPAIIILVIAVLLWYDGIKAMKMEKKPSDTEDIITGSMQADIN